MTLEELGWNPYFATAFAPHAAAGRRPARVTLQLKGYCEVTGEAGAQLGEITGRFLHDAAKTADFPAVGDWVAVSSMPGEAARAQIHAVLPRRTRFSRRTAGDEAVIEQVVAANIDTVLLVCALDGTFNLRRLERYLAAAWASGAQPVVLLNKADLADDADGSQTEIAGALPGVPVFVVSAQTRRGLKALAPHLRPGTTIALLGPSGAGKSTLINRFVGDQIQFTQEVRDADGKGRHTTTNRELIVAPGGFIVIDTPGMREIQPWDAEAGVTAAFDDVAAVAARCKFRDCSHTVEPGCAVQAALAGGTLELARWQSYQRLRRATAHEVRQVSRPAQIRHKSEAKKLTKGLRRRIREKHGDE